MSFPELVFSTAPVRESDADAILLALPAGNYSAVVNGANTATGTALFEVYVVP